MDSEAHSSRLCDLDFAAQVIESAHETQDGFGAVASGEVIGPQILVFDLIFERVPDSRGGDRQDGLFCAAPCYEAQELALPLVRTAASQDWWHSLTL